MNLLHSNNPAMTSQLHAQPDQVKLNLRLLLVCFATVSVSLGTAFSAIGRLALYLVALWLVIANMTAKKPKQFWPNSVWNARWETAALLAVAYMALSVLWTEADLTKSILSWTRHARLLTIPLVWILLRDRTEARLVLRVFVIAQLLVVASSWLLIGGFPVPWATALTAKTTYAVFGTYLEQSIMGATLVFILWHQREWIFGAKGQCLAIAAALFTGIQVLGFLNGRSGYLVFTALASMAIIYQLPKHWRWAAVLVPFVTVAIVLAGSKTARDRVFVVQQEIAAYSQRADINTSSGERLIYWETSLRAIAEKPLFGFGSGGWNHEFQNLTDHKLDQSFYNIDNPHQMYLLWAVEGGLTGLALLLGLFVSLYMRSRSLAASDARSLQSALAALAVAGLTTSTIYGIGMGDYFCMLIGILLCTGRDMATPPTPKIASSL
jgi:O-antigen ligase